MFSVRLSPKADNDADIGGVLARFGDMPADMPRQTMAADAMIELAASIAPPMAKLASLVLNSFIWDLFQRIG